MKKASRLIAIFVALIMVLALVPMTALADTYYGIVIKNVYFRTGPDSSYAKVTGYEQLDKGTTFIVIDNVNYGDYWKINYNDIVGYVSSSYVEFTTATVAAATGTSDSTSGSLGGSSSLGSTPVSVSVTDTSSGSLGSSSSLSGTAATSGSTATTIDVSGAATGVATQNVYFRTGPGRSYAKVAGVDQIDKGTAFYVMDSKSYGDYWQIVYNNTLGYVYGSYAKITAAATGTTTTGTSGSTSGSLSSGSSLSSTPVTTTDTSSGSLGSSSSLGGSTTGTTSGSTSYATGVTTATCNFRTGPSTSYARVSGCTQIPASKQITVLDNTSSKYWKVTYNGYTGWIYGSYAKIVSSTTTTGTTTGTTTTPTTGTTSGSLKYARYTGTSQDIWGSIQIDGTNINGYIYCNAIDSKGNFYYNAYSSSYNYFYALSYYGSPIEVIYGHDMRKSGVGFHELHHVQNAWLGVSKCENDGASCSGAKTSVFNINYDGSTRWQLCGFFELSSATMSSSSSRKNINIYASMQSNLTGAAKQKWIDTMMSYCVSTYKGATLASMSSSDKVMLLVTCADKSGNDYQRFYMLLKAIN